MRHDVERLQQLRTELESIKNKLADSKADWELANRVLLLDKETTEDMIRELDCEIRNKRVSLWDGTDKSKIFGVGVREYTHLNYDQKVAYEWAVEHVMFLKLDKGGFEKYARDGKLDFVIVKKIVQATIAGDLSKYLEDTDGV